MQINVQSKNSVCSCHCGHFFTRIPTAIRECIISTSERCKIIWIKKIGSVARRPLGYYLFIRVRVFVNPHCVLKIHNVFMQIGDREALERDGCRAQKYPVTSLRSPTDVTSHAPEACLGDVTGLSRSWWIDGESACAFRFNRITHPKNGTLLLSALLQAWRDIPTAFLQLLFYLLDSDDVYV